MVKYLKIVIGKCVKHVEKITILVVKETKKIDLLRTFSFREYLEIHTCGGKRVQSLVSVEDKTVGLL